MGTTASPDATTAPDREVLTWEGFGDASRELTQQIVDSGWIPDLIVAIARGGLIPAGAIAYAMDVKAIGTMNVEFYSGIGETLEEPQLLPPLMDVSAMDGKRVLVVDDVADSGKTLKMVMDLIDEHGLTLDGSAAVHVEARSAGFGLGLVLGAAFVPCAGPVLTSIIVASNSGQITWHIIGLAVSFAIGVSIPLMIVAIAGSGVAARFLKTRQRPLRIGAGVAMIALALGIATDAPMTLQRMIPDYTAALEVGTEGACEDGSCKPEKDVEASTDFAQCARGGAKDCGVMPTLQASQWLNTLGQPSGTVTLVDFWSSSCTNCQREIPELEAIYEKYKDYGLVVVGVHSPQQAFERDASVVNASIEKLGITYPVALDPDLEAFKAYGATAWPTHFIAGADGKLVAMGRGTKGVEEIIRALLSEAGQTLPD